MQRKEDREPPSGPNVAKAQVAAFRGWERISGTRFADLKGLLHPTLVVQGFHDEMIPVRNSYWLAENLPNAILLMYPDAGHGSLYQYSELSPDTWWRSCHQTPSRRRFERERLGLKMNRVDENRRSKASRSMLSVES
jgi:pimeloyl-ACP methyl ester carboxylesterase